MEGKEARVVNWFADDWFIEKHAGEMSDEFKGWWLGYYGYPDDYSDDVYEIHEYWVRCAFALRGWLAGRETTGVVK